eukprot:gene10621-biopygen10838
MCSCLRPADGAAEERGRFYGLRPLPHVADHPDAAVDARSQRQPAPLRVRAATFPSPRRTVTPHYPFCEVFSVTRIKRSGSEAPRAESDGELAGMEPDAPAAAGGRARDLYPHLAGVGNPASSGGLLVCARARARVVYLRFPPHFLGEVAKRPSPEQSPFGPDHVWPALGWTGPAAAAPWPGRPGPHQLGNRPARVLPQRVSAPLRTGQHTARRPLLSVHTVSQPPSESRGASGKGSGHPVMQSSSRWMRPTVVAGRDGGFLTPPPGLARRRQRYTGGAPSTGLQGTGGSHLVARTLSLKLGLNSSQWASPQNPGGGVGVRGWKLGLPNDEPKLPSGPPPRCPGEAFPRLRLGTMGAVAHYWVLG